MAFTTISQFGGKKSDRNSISVDLNSPLETPPEGGGGGVEQRENKKGKKGVIVS